MCIGYDFAVVPDQREQPEEYEAPYLGADEVVDEVITLLAKMENDRQETLDKLKTERQRVGMLGGKIDGLAMGRLMGLPAAVQNGMIFVIRHHTTLKTHLLLF